jgi:ribosomal protein L37E
MISANSDSNKHGIEPVIDLPWPLVAEGDEAVCPRCGMESPIDAETQVCYFCWFDMSTADRSTWRDRVKAALQAGATGLLFGSWCGWLFL